MPYMTRKAGANVVKLLLLGLMVQLVVIGYVFYQSYAGRADLVQAQRNGCERGKLDRNANAEGWRIAEAARKADGQIVVANHYAKIASGLELRSRINCSTVFPGTSFLP